ncbi:hypothetical protein N9M30_02005 [Pseudomonadales bacterium]|nr:hypothetical protein [Pseudomonadales bacterium]
MRYLQSAAIILCMCASSLSAAEEALTIFKAGDKVKAAEINANFELLRAAAADAVSFEGLDDVYGGVVSETVQASSSQSGISAQSDLMSGVEFKQVAGRQNSVNALAETIIPCSAEDKSCVINGNKVSVKCDGTLGKLGGVLASPLANAAFLKVEVEGDCVEAMLVTRGAAFFSKTGTRASITAREDQFAVAVADYVHFENIDLNGRLTVGRGAMVILEKDVKLVSDPTRSTNTGDLAIYATEGGFVKLGRNIDIEGSIIVGNATLNVYGDGVNVSSQIIVNGGSLEADSQFVPGVGNVLAGLTTPNFIAVYGAVVNLKNGAFNFNNLDVNGATVSISSTGATPISSLETGGIWVHNGGSLNLSKLSSIVFNDKSTAFLNGTLSLWDNSTAFISIDQNASIPALQVVTGSQLRLGPVAGSYFTVQNLAVGWGGHITSNSSTGDGSKNIVVENSLTATANSAIQWGIVDRSNPPSTLNIADGCASKGINSDLCDLIAN